MCPSTILSIVLRFKSFSCCFTIFNYLTETPLTAATSLKQPAKVIMALINGGALLDFRTKDGLTALHKAVERNNLEALRVSVVCLKKLKCA